MTSESELAGGNLVVPQCPSCNIIMWPPSGFCSRCLKSTVWGDAPSEGEIVEFSRRGERYFCVADLGRRFRVIGGITYGIPEVGKKVRIEKCGVRDDSYFFDMRVL